MSLIDFFNGNPALSGAVLGTLGTLLGVIVTQISGIFVKRFEVDAQIRYRKFDWSWEFEKKNVIEPILTFLDSDLKLMAFVYTKGFEDKGEAGEELKNYILDLSTVYARIQALDDCELSEKFNEFTSKRLSIGNIIQDPNRKDMGSAFRELKEAEKLAGEIILSIKMRIRQQDKLLRRFK